MVEKKNNVLDVVEYASESRSSFDLKSTSKGATIEVKIYSGDNEDDIIKARQTAEKHFDELLAKYKAVDGEQ